MRPGEHHQNIIGQLKSALALQAPRNTLEANWAYRVMASRAWSIKAWFALALPIAERSRECDQSDQRHVMGMGFRG